MRNQRHSMYRNIIIEKYPVEVDEEENENKYFYATNYPKAIIKEIHELRKKLCVRDADYAMSAARLGGLLINARYFVIPGCYIKWLQERLRMPRPEANMYISIYKSIIEIRSND